MLKYTTRSSGNRKFRYSSPRWVNIEEEANVYTSTKGAWKQQFYLLGVDGIWACTC